MRRDLFRLLGEIDVDGMGCVLCVSLIAGHRSAAMAIDLGWNKKSPVDNMMNYGFENALNAHYETRIEPASQ